MILFLVVIFFWVKLKTFSEIDYSNIVSAPMQWCERTINGQQKYTFKARSNLQNRHIPLLYIKNVNIKKDSSV